MGIFFPERVFGWVFSQAMVVFARMSQPIWGTKDSLRAAQPWQFAAVGAPDVACAPWPMLLWWLCILCPCDLWPTTSRCQYLLMESTLLQICEAQQWLRCCHVPFAALRWLHCAKWMSLLQVHWDKCESCEARSHLRRSVPLLSLQTTQGLHQDRWRRFEWLDSWSDRPKSLWVHIGSTHLCSVFPSVGPDAMSQTPSENRDLSSILFSFFSPNSVDTLGLGHLHR